MRRAVLLILFVGLFSFCKKDPKPIQPTFTKEYISGHNQKGPFLNGSSLSVFELDNSLSQTGQSFNTQTIDNTGLFELSNLNIITSFVKLKADGFYFNEISNSNSASGITLYALSDLQSKSTVNINLLTHLEVSRIEYLVSNGQTFASAKLQVQKEILKIFSISKNGLVEPELMDISQNTDDNAILLAASLILQGYRTEAELSQLLGDIITDIRTDGVLNSSSLGTKLINDAKLFNVVNIRQNIENKYLSMGVNASIPNFEKYIKQFKDSTNFVFTNNILYPYIVNSLQNVLKDSTFSVFSGQYSFSAFLPIGTSVKIVAKGNPNLGGFGPWIMQNNGWTINIYSPDSAIYSANGINQSVNVPVQFMPSDNIDFFIYENGATVPTRTKTIVVP